MGTRASNGPRSITVQDEVSVKRACANSSGVATFGPIDCRLQQSDGDTRYSLAIATVCDCRAHACMTYNSLSASIELQTFVSKITALYNVCSARFVITTYPNVCLEHGARIRRLAFVFPCFAVESSNTGAGCAAHTGTRRSCHHDGPTTT